MSRKRLTRREFLESTTSAAALTALAPLLGKVRSARGSTVMTEGVPIALSHCAPSGGEMVLHLINVKVLRRRRSVRIVDPDVPALLVAQLPPQHLNEASMSDADAAPSEVFLSGPSFVAFTMWPKRDNGKRRRLEMKISRLLDWHDSGLFRLRTLGEADEHEPTSSASGLRTPAAVDGDSGLLSFAYYRTLLARVPGSGSITLLELPAGLLVTPMPEGASRGLMLLPFGARQPRSRSASVRAFSLTTRGEQVRREVHVRWHAVLEGDNETSDDSDDTGVQLRAQDVLRSESSVGVLPSTQHLRDLVEQTRSGAGTTGTMRPERWLSLSDTGVSGRLAFRRPSLEMSATGVASYVHDFAGGRDARVELTQLGVCFPSGLRAKHVAINERVVRNGRSYLEPREYIEFLEEEASYGASETGSSEFLLPSGARETWALARATAFRAVGREVRKTADIHRVLGKESRHENAKCFWAYRTLQPGETFMPTSERLLRIPHRVVDSRGEVFSDVSMPVLFLSDEFLLQGEPVLQAWLDHPSFPAAAGLREWDDARLRIQLNRRPFGYSVLAPEATRSEDEYNASTVETDWLEVFPSVASSTDLRLTRRVVPRMRRAQVYLESLQALSPMAVPSIVEYHDKYLADDDRGNPERFVLRHPDDFRENRVAGWNGANRLGELAIGPAPWSLIRGVFASAHGKLGSLANPDPLLVSIADADNAIGTPELRQWSPDGFAASDLFPGERAELLAGIRLADVLGMLAAEYVPRYLVERVRDEVVSVESLRKRSSAISTAIDAVNQHPDIATLQRAHDELKASVVQHRARLDEATQILSVVENELAALGAEAARLVTLGEQALRVYFVEALLNLRVRSAATEPRLRAVLALRGSTLHVQADASFWPAFFARVGALALTHPNASLRLPPTAPFSSWGVVAGLLFSPDLASNIDNPGSTARLAIARLTEAAGDDASIVAAPLRLLLSRGEEFARADPTLLDMMTSARAPLSLLALVSPLLFDEWRVRESSALADALRTWSGSARPDASLSKVAEAAVQLATDASASFARATSALETRGDEVQSALDGVIRTNPVLHAVRARLETARVKRERLIEELRQLDQSLKSAARELLSASRRRALVLSADASGTVAADARAAARELSDALRSVKRQRVGVEWTTSAFKPVDVGIVRFSPNIGGKTTLEVHAVQEARFALEEGGSVTAEVSGTAHSRLSHFGMTFFSVLGVNFNHIVFTQTNGNVDVDVSVRDVTFGGALSFVQVLEAALGKLVPGATLSVGTDGVTVGYRTPSLAIGSPGFAFTGLTVAVTTFIGFRGSPLTCQLDIASREEKAIVSAGIYGGAFYFSIKCSVRGGVVEVAAALELGAYFGLRLGVISGYVRFMVGLEYKKSEGEVFLAGYFIAEGMLRVWIVSVSARLYMGVESRNSVVTGRCVMSYSIKVGFVKKRFSATFTRRIAGAKRNGSSDDRDRTLSGTEVSVEGRSARTTRVREEMRELNLLSPARRPGGSTKPALVRRLRRYCAAVNQMEA